MIAALFLQVAALPILPSNVWASISATDSLAHRSTLVEFLRHPDDAADGQYSVRLTLRHLDEPPTIMWATSRTCRGVRDAVANLKAVPFPTVQLPGDPSEIVMDGTGYSVRLPVGYGAQIGWPATFRSNVGTPLADWVEQTIVVLRPCWSATLPLTKPAP